LTLEEVIFFKSPVDAMRHVQEQANQASSLLERNHLTNDNGEQIGDRLVLQFEERDGRKPHAVVNYFE